MIAPLWIRPLTIAEAITPQTHQRIWQLVCKLRAATTPRDHEKYATHLGMVLAKLVVVPDPERTP